MPRIAYVSPKAFKPATVALMEHADRIATDYRRRGFNLSLRQLYYQFVSLDLIPNSEASYNRLGRVVNDARMAGVMDWSHLEDRGREAHSVNWMGHVPPAQAELIRQAKYGYSLDLWEGQHRRIEVWVEKQALEEVAERAANRWRVGYFACKGYVSQSEMWAAGRRLRRQAQAGAEPLILHLGDHDPSGIDMTRDIGDRLSLFADRPIEVKRIALNMDQIDELNPPPNPAKQTDSRFEAYAERFGVDESWELDAVRPEDLIELIDQEIRTYVDYNTWAEQVAAEGDGHDEFDRIADRWDEITTYLDEDER